MRTWRWARIWSCASRRTRTLAQGNRLLRLPLSINCIGTIHPSPDPRPPPDPDSFSLYATHRNRKPTQVLFPPTGVLQPIETKPWHFADYVGVTGQPAPQSGFSEAFGRSIAIAATGLYAAVSAPLKTLGADRAQGGEVYVFNRTSLTSNWTFVQKLRMPFRTAHENFGWGVDMASAGDVIAVSARNTLLHGERSNRIGKGRVFMFYRRLSDGIYRHGSNFGQSKPSFAAPDLTSLGLDIRTRTYGAYGWAQDWPSTNITNITVWSVTNATDVRYSTLRPDNFGENIKVR